MAIGNPDFIELAVDMVLSYKHFNNEPVSCIVDNQSKNIIEKRYSVLFDQLIILPDNYNLGRTRKFSCAELTPYESTIFIDSDILFLNNISNLWDEGEANNYITMIGDYLEKESSAIHHGFSISELIETGRIHKYFKGNSGFFHFMKEPSRRFFEECQEKYEELFSGSTLNKRGWIGDEIAIGMVSDKFNVNCFKTPSPMMWEDRLAKLKIDENEFPICHFIAPIPLSTVKELVSRAKKFRELSQLPRGGEKVWIRLNEKRRMARKSSVRLRLKGKIYKYFKSFQKSAILL